MAKDLVGEEGGKPAGEPGAMRARVRTIFPNPLYIEPMMPNRALRAMTRTSFGFAI